MNKPKISVLLPVYNGEKYLKESILSILDQSYSNFELIIINDASTDRSKQIIQSFHDPRIRYLENTSNLGLPKSLNKGLKESKGEFIARQDTDDIAIKERFETQVEFLKTNKSFGMVGTWAEVWREENKINKFLKHPTENKDIKLFLLFNNAFVHSSVMIRKECFEKIGLYNENYQAAQDYELWSRIAKNYDLANIPLILQIYREVSKSISRIKKNSFENVGLNISIENIGTLFKDKKEIFKLKALSLFINNRFDLIDKNTRISQLEDTYNASVEKILCNKNEYSKELWQKNLNKYNHYHSFKSKLTRFIYGK